MNRQLFIEHIKGFIGIPYAHQGITEIGMDCIGLVVAAAKKQGVELPVPLNYGREPLGTAILDIINKCTQLNLVNYEDILPGDILVFSIKRHPQHIGVFIGESNGLPSMVHAVMGVDKVAETHLGPGWLQKLVGVAQWQTM